MKDRPTKPPGDKKPSPGKSPGEGGKTRRDDVKKASRLETDKRPKPQK